MTDKQSFGARRISWMFAHRKCPALRCGDMLVTAFGMDALPQRS